MKTFGETLRKYIEESGFNIYQFARISGINRISIQRYATDQRFPAPDTFETILNHLQLKPYERQELETSYEIAKAGKLLYFQRLSVKELLESIATIYISEEQLRPYSLDCFPGNTLELLSCLPEKVCSFSGFINIQHIFQTELIRISYVWEKPCVSLFLPTDPGHALLNTSLTSLAFSPEHTLLLTQMFYLTKMNANSDHAGSHNLNILSAILPLSFSTRFDYQAYYYYDDYMSNQNFGILFPYYAIFNDCLMLFSQDMENAFLSFDKILVKLYQERFTHHLKYCQKMLQTADGYMEHLKRFPLSDTPFCSYTEYMLNYQPCLGSIGDLELADALLHDNLENRELILKTMATRLQMLQNPDVPHHHYFTEQGLIDFIESGACMEFPPTLIKECPLSLRLMLLCRLREVCETGRQLLRITGPAVFHIPSYLFLTVTEAKVSLFNYQQEASWSAISIEETGILSALIDFLSYLPDSPYVYSKEKTLAILDRHIASLRQKLEKESF